MDCKIAMAQTMSSTDDRKNLQKAESFLKKAQREAVDILIFPEYFMTYYPSDHYRAKAQTLEGSFVIAMKELAQTYRMWIVFGMNQAPVDDSVLKSYNTIVILNQHGELCGTYQKTHLFNAYHWQESKDTLPGEQLAPIIETPFGLLSIGTCYDLRFPEVARLAALKGAELMLYPSAWVKGEKKFMQWKALLQARAIENEMFVLGCCHFSEKHYMGQSLAISPEGDILVQGDEEEQLLVCEISLDQMKETRRLNPVLDNRRVKLYQEGL